jgi:transcription antitermination factor NusG
MQQAPFFSGYLFVQANLDLVPVSSINAVPGVVRMVAFGERPRPIGNSVVEALRQRIDDLNANGGLVGPVFLSGDNVRIMHGPLQGLEAVFIGPMKPRERVRVLLDFLGSDREVEVGLDVLEPSKGHTSPQRERGTRGKGRTIKRPGFTQP